MYRRTRQGPRGTSRQEAAKPGHHKPKHQGTSEPRNLGGTASMRKLAMCVIVLWCCRNFIIFIQGIQLQSPVAVMDAPAIPPAIRPPLPPRPSRSWSHPSRRNNNHDTNRLTSLTDSEQESIEKLASAARGSSYKQPQIQYPDSTNLRLSYRNSALELEEGLPPWVREYFSWHAR